ncbi:MAG: hypothetical protein HRU09_01755 [Oligoflexales bacterium]|nr:hypothetical protein [Oligoflexales bacterium]
MKKFCVNFVASLSIIAYSSYASGVTRLNQSDAKVNGEFSEDELVNSEESNSRQVGKKNHYNLRIGASRVSFPDVKYFEAFYGSTPTQFSISSDWQYYVSDYVNLGVGGQFSYLNIGGKQKINPDVSDPDPSELQNAEGKLSLTVLPYQLLLTASAKPFGSGSFLSIDFWLGYEELFYQEVRLQNSTTSAESTSTPSLNASDTPSKKTSQSSGGKSIVNTGWNNGVVAGVSLNFLINKLGEKSLGSMKRSMGLGAIYISPYFEMVSKIGSKLLIAQQKSNDISFAHQNIGLAFTFKTAP